ncbi:MAG: class I SAM-dependent methyltransferase, partial [Anaerolineales bacterium]|nr:class I SAM-dependent methyltransferase [Anaerolineales bacterium]
MQDFYDDFYTAVPRSRAHHLFCERVFGLDLGQHGFADVEQLDLLRQVTGLQAGQAVLDVGCGQGLIAEYLADLSGARVTGLDLNSQAIAQAQQRTAVKADRLAFQVGDINRLELPDSTFDVILGIDSLYFSEDYAATIRALRAALRPGGQMAFLYSFGREPWIPKDHFPKEMILPANTPLAQALQANQLPFRTWDLTAQDYALAQRRKQVLAELKPLFAAEGTLFIYENRLGDAVGISQAIEEGLHGRYLYHVQC